MKTKWIVRRAILLSALGLSLGVPAQAATINLGGLNWVTYGDGNSYSLPISNLQFGYNTQNGPYTVASGPGQIQDLTVLATGSNGQGVTTNTLGIDNAYETPNGTNSTLPYFYFNAGNLNTPNTNGASILNNGANTWDASVASLLNFLGGEDMVFFFNNNQTKSGSAADEELAAWARIWITDSTGAVLGTFEFTNNDGKYDVVTNGGGGVFMGNPTAYTAPGSGAGNPSSVSASSTDFVLSGGEICVEYVPGNPLFAPIPVPCGSAPSFYPGGVVSGAINHNLGADRATYAVIFPELNALLASLAASGSDLSGYTLHFDGRFGCTGPTSGDPSPWMSSAYANGNGTCLNNGYEQIFIGTASTTEVGPVPEPATLTMLGLGLGLVSIVARRRRAAR